MTDLFEKAAPKPGATKDSTRSPLADRVRPRTLTEIVGQDHLLAEGKLLQQAIERDELFSMIFWGPPGVGKTTLARVIARETNSDFYALSAVTAGVKDVRRVLERARLNLRRGKRTVLFIDEIHRFNKAQQDALLHEVENGTIYLIGATTENPSFEVIAPLLSRCRVFQLYPLKPEEIDEILERALQKDPVLAAKTVRFEPGARELLVRLAGGDARMALNALELAFTLASAAKEENEIFISRARVQEAFQSKSLFYDKAGDYHYDIISAFIKSVRGSDPDAALYWLARMIDAGEDPKFIARRLVILASEDIGNADPFALVLATSAFTAITYIGMPEGQLVLAQAATYLASAPKSNASYKAIMQALEDVKQHGPLPVPLSLRNAPTGLMAHFGYGKEYKYPHDFDGHFVPVCYFPEELGPRTYYRPTEEGKEKEIRQRLERLWSEKRRQQAKGDRNGKGHRD